MRVPALLAATAVFVLPFTACSSGPDSAEPAGSAVAPEVSADERANSGGTQAETPEPESSAPAGSVDQVKPQAQGMAVDAFADAVLDQLKFAGPGTLSDQLVTIAMSPLTRQMASSADIGTRLDAKGEKVIFTLTGSDMTCKVTVTDAPAARGVNCVA